MDNARLQIKGLPVSEKPQAEAYSELHCSQCRPTLEIPEDKDGSHTANIRATLASYNLPNSSGKENVKQLTNFAAMNGKKLDLMKNVRPVQKDESPKKKELKCKPSPTVKESSQAALQSDIQAEKPKKTIKLKTSGKAA